MIEPTSSASTFPSPLARMRPPYQTLEPVSPERGLPPVRPVPAGEALVWFMAGGDWERCFQLARSRAPGVALIVILPPAPQSESDQERILRTVERCHPHSVLPHHPDPDLEELELVLRRPSAYPQDDIVEYLGWRGLRITQEMRELIRRVLELSSEIGSVSALARGVFISRRALGRRFLSAGLPVPSHWLQMGRLMRIVGVIQAEPTSLFNAGTALGYSDGFAVSNQMVRLTGVRPSKVRTHLGWEWVLEAWLRREAENGGFSPTNARILLRRRAEAPDPDPTPPASAALRVPPSDTDRSDAPTRAVRESSSTTSRPRSSRPQRRARTHDDASGAADAD